MMVGIDIERVERFHFPLSESFLQQVFTDAELAYVRQHSCPEMHLCGFFCAKEAVRKASGGTLELSQVEIHHDEIGAPVARLLSGSLPGKRIAISVSHTVEYAVANAVIYDE